MHRAVVIGVILASLAACGDQELARLENIKAEVCACKDAACAEAAMKKVPEHEIKSNRETQKVAREMLECLAELYELGRPSTDPDDEAPEVTDPGSAAGASGGTP